MRIGTLKTSKTLGTIPYWKSIIALLFGLPFDIYLSFCVRTSQAEELNINHRSFAIGNDKPLIFFGWHQNCFFYRSVATHSDLKKIAWIAHDGINSLMFTLPALRSGLNAFVFTRNAKTSGIQQLRESLEYKGSSIGIFPDSGGPYLKVKPGIIRLAKLTSASLIPLGIVPKKFLTLGKQKQYRIPLPFSKVYFQLGKPVELIPGESLEVEQANTALCERLLNEISERS